MSPPCLNWTRREQKPVEFLFNERFRLNSSTMFQLLVLVTLRRDIHFSRTGSDVKKIIKKCPPSLNWTRREQKPVEFLFNERFRLNSSTVFQLLVLVTLRRDIHFSRTGSDVKKY